MKKALLIGLLAASLYGNSPTVTPSPTQSPVPITQISKPKLSQKQGTRVPIICFHRVAYKPTSYTQVTPARVREVFNYLYDNCFVLVSLDSIVEKKFNIPQGTKPVGLTWDDNLVNCLFVSEYVNFTTEHPDFGRAATVFVSSPNKNFGLNKLQAQALLNTYCGLNIDVQPHGTEHLYMGNSTLEEITAEVNPIVSKLSAFDFNPRYYAFPGGIVPKSKKGRAFFKKKFKAVFGCTGGLYNLKSKGNYVPRTDMAHFKEFKQKIKENENKLYIKN